MPTVRFGVGRIIIAASLSLVAIAVACLRAPSAVEADPAKSNVLRVPWTSSHVVGSPDPPPPFKVVRAFPKIKFEHPLLIARPPGSKRLFVGEQAGVLYSFVDQPDAKADLFCDLRKEIKTIHLLADAKEVEAVYGLTFHPKFQENRQCFVCYTLRAKDPRNHNLKDGSRVSRFLVTKTEPPRIDPGSEQIIITFLQGGHNGGDIHFGPDGMLYISTGDAANPNPPDPLNTGQDISDLLSSILRIDVDHHEGEPGGARDGEPGALATGGNAPKNYAIPKDNPFIGMKNARPEVWAYGLRNPWRMGFDRQTGELFVGDVGWELWESIHRVEKGGNYGWSAMEGPQPIKPGKVGPTPIRPALIELPHTISCSVTGGRVYRGRKFPELRGAYLFGDWETRRLWAARFEGDRTKEMPEIARPSVRIVAFGEDKNGELYFLDYEGGTIHTIERNDRGTQNTHFPTKLSETGLFLSGREQTPAPGVLPFAINSRQWQDGATARHWVALPGTSFVTLYKQGKPIPGMVDWHHFRSHFPRDAVLARTISVSGRRVETQVLHYDGVDWHAYSFAWRDDQSDADLVPADGMEKVLAPVADAPSPVANVPGSPQQKTLPPVANAPSAPKPSRVWQFQSRSQCMSCHSAWSEYALAFQPAQLNRQGADGRNQLVTLTELGLIQRDGNDGKPLPPFDAQSAAKEWKLADPNDGTQPLEARARSYLHANCGHCHSEGGGGSVNLRLQFPVTIPDMHAVGVRPARGDFGLPDACIVKPGDPWASTLYFRMAKFGRDRMPHIGSDQPDETGLNIVEQWIAGMNPASAKTVPSDKSEPLDKVLANASTALALARKLGRAEINPAERNRLLAAAGKLPASPIRDLFEGYFPDDGKGPRKLGSNPRPRTILALQGDSTKGEKLFWSQAMNCGTCHKIGDRGTALGPDLTTIGKLRQRADLLESILQPSRRIEPKYVTYVAQTTDGRLLTGLLESRDDREVVLRDAQNKRLVLDAKSVEALRPSRTSLMPEGQLAGLTAQEAADLLEYLATRR